MKIGMAVYNPKFAENILRRGRGQGGLFAQDISLIYLLPKSTSLQGPMSAPDQFTLNLFLTLNICYSITGGASVILDSIARKLRQHVTGRGMLTQAGLSDLDTHIWRQLAVKEQNVNRWRRHFPEAPWAEVWTRLQKLADQKQNNLPLDGVKVNKTKTKAKKKTKKQIESDNRRLAQLTELVQLDRNLSADILTTLLPRSDFSGFRPDKPLFFPAPRLTGLGDRPDYQGQAVQMSFPLQKSGRQSKTGQTEREETFFFPLAPNTTAAHMLQVFAPPPRHIYQGRLLNFDQGDDQGRGDDLGRGLSQRQKYGSFSSQSLEPEILTSADPVLWGGDAVQRKWRDHIRKRFALIEGRGYKSAASAQRERLISKDGHPLAADLIPRMSLNLTQILSYKMRNGSQVSQAWPAVLRSLPDTASPDSAQDEPAYVNPEPMSVNLDFTTASLSLKVTSVSPAKSSPDFHFRSNRGGLQVGGPGQEFWARSAFQDRSAIQPRRTLGVLSRRSRSGKRFGGEASPELLMGDMEYGVMNSVVMDYRVMDYGAMFGMADAEPRPASQARGTGPAAPGSLLAPKFPFTVRHDLGQKNLVNHDFASVNHNFTAAQLNHKVEPVGLTTLQPEFRSSRLRGQKFFQESGLTALRPAFRLSLKALQAAGPERTRQAGQVVRPKRALGVLRGTERFDRETLSETLPGVMDSGPHSSSRAGEPWMAVFGNLLESKFPTAAQYESERLNNVNLDFASVNHDSTLALANLKTASSRPVASPLGFRSSREELQVGRTGQEFWDRLLIRLKRTLGVLERRSRSGKRSGGEASPERLMGTMDYGTMDYGTMDYGVMDSGPRSAGQIGQIWPAVSGSLPGITLPLIQSRHNRQASPSPGLPGTMLPFILQNDLRRASLRSASVNLASPSAILKTAPLRPTVTRSASRSGSRLSLAEPKVGKQGQTLQTVRKGESPSGEGQAYSLLQTPNPEPRITNAPSLGDPPSKLILRNSTPEPQTTVKSALSSSLPSPKANPDIIRTVGSEQKTKIKQLPTRAQVKNEEPQPDIEAIVRKVYKKIEQQLRYERVRRGR